MFKIAGKPFSFVTFSPFFSFLFFSDRKPSVNCLDLYRRDQKITRDFPVTKQTAERRVKGEVGVVERRSGGAEGSCTGF